MGRGHFAQTWVIKPIENKRENGDLIRDFLMANNTSETKRIFGQPIDISNIERKDFDESAESMIETLKNGFEDGELTPMFLTVKQIREFILASNIDGGVNMKILEECQRVKEEDEKWQKIFKEMKQRDAENKKRRDLANSSSRDGSSSSIANSRSNDNHESFKSSKNK